MIDYAGVARDDRKALRRAAFIPNRQSRSYNRTQHLEQRRKMMQHWADYLDQLKATASTSNVINANFGR
jgi:hypothetical protein